ncbi:MAG: spore germination protein [Clostridia bacterium]
MFSFLVKKLNHILKSSKRPDESNNTEDAPKLISKSLLSNVEMMKKILGESSDIKYHDFLFGDKSQYAGLLVYIEGLADSKVITEGILTPILVHKNELFSEGEEMSIGSLKRTIICSGDILESGLQNEVVNACLSGKIVMFIEGAERALLISAKGWETRAVSEPQTESVVRGPREGFTENIRTNTSLIRRKIKSPLLRMEHMTLGKKTSTAINILYLEGVAKDEVLQILRQRLKNIDVDSILDAGYIEEYIEDDPRSIFSTVGYSEKPDVIAAKMLEGRIAIVVDGSPFVLTVPMLFIESFQTAEDYYVRPFYASLVRFLRLIAYLLSIFTVPTFITLTTYHQEFIPTTLLFTIANAREGTPFPVLIEALIMVFSFEILREAGLRLPRPVGQSISIVGALVMGDAAVAAGLVGAPIVIMVALSAVAGFTIPTQADSISIIRVAMMLIAAFLGGFGLAMGFIIMLIHLGKIKSFGVHYFGGLAPDYNQQDNFIRLSLLSMKKRPMNIVGEDVIRRGEINNEQDTGSGQ